MGSTTDLSTQNKGGDSLKKIGQLIFETVLFSMLASLMFVSKIIMELLPNVHLLGMFVITFTVVFRAKALIPIYLYVFLNGLYAGFNAWWVPYLYVWTVLWALAMLIPRKTPKWLACIIYPTLCALHGLAFGVLYAPAQALLFGLSFEQMLAWIAVGFPFDVIHCISNLCAGLLIYPLSELIKKLIARSRYKI